MDIVTLGAAIGAAKKNLNNVVVPVSASDAGKIATVDSNGKYVAAELEVGHGEVAVDNTLLVSGAAADAKVTGDKVNELKSAINVSYTPISLTAGGYVFTAGSVGSVINLTPNSNANYKYAIVDATAGDKFVINGTGVNNAYLWTFIDEDNKILTRADMNAVGADLHLTAPTNAAKLVLNTSATAAGDCYKGSNVTDLINDVNIIGDNGYYRIVAGVIRNSGSGWDFIINANHRGNLNCDSVGIYQADGRLYVDYSGINAKKVISLLCAPDETFASLGYFTGASVGLTAAYIQIYKHPQKMVSATAEFSSGQDGINITLSRAMGVSSITWDDTNKCAIVNHDAVNDVSNTALVVSVLPWLYSAYIPRVRSWSGTNTSIEFIDPLTGAKVTTPDTKMSFVFSRMATNHIMAEIDPSTVANPNGNIWFMGIFEV